MSVIDFFINKYIPVATEFDYKTVHLLVYLLLLSYAKLILTVVKNEINSD